MKTTIIPPVKTPLKTIALLVITSAAIALATSSCGTVRGFGRDVGTAGDTIVNSTHGR